MSSVFLTLGQKITAGVKPFFAVWDLALMMVLSAGILAMFFYMLTPQPILSIEILGDLQPPDLSRDSAANPFSEPPQPLQALSKNSIEPTHLNININTANAVELEQLPGVGPKIARRIIQHRQKNGRFQDPKDLLEVRGIGPKGYSQIRHFLAI